MLVERQVDLKIININFHQWLIQREWTSLYLFECTAYGSLVQECYNNIHDIGQESFKLFVCGMTVEINPNYLSQFLEIDISLDALYPIPEPDSDDLNDEDNTDWDVVATILCGRRREWLGGVLKQKFLTPSNHILNIFAYFNVEPKGRTSEIIMETGYLLYMIRTR